VPERGSPGLTYGKLKNAKTGKENCHVGGDWGKSKLKGELTGMYIYEQLLETQELLEATHLGKKGCDGVGKTQRLASQRATKARRSKKIQDKKCLDSRKRGMAAVGQIIKSNSFEKRGTQPGKKKGSRTGAGPCNKRGKHIIQTNRAGKQKKKGEALRGPTR